MIFKMWMICLSKVIVTKLSKSDSCQKGKKKEKIEILNLKMPNMVMKYLNRRHEFSVPLLFSTFLCEMRGNWNRNYNQIGRNIIRKYQISCLL